MLVFMLAEPELKVLLVDDSPLIRDRLIELLAEIPGIRVVGEAKDADEALRLFAERAPDVILLDVRLNRGKALSVLKHMVGARPEAKVIVLSNHSEPEIRLSFCEAGAYRFFDKSLEFDGALREVADLGRGAFPVPQTVGHL